MYKVVHDSGVNLRNLLVDYTVLYAEDELSIQKNMQEYLEGYFKKVYVASDGKEALEKYHELRPDVLILDIDLPHMDGLLVAKSIREKDKETSILMLTAFTDKEKLLSAIGLKLLRYLVKPLDLIEFQNTLDALAVELSEMSRNILSLGDSYMWDTKNELLLYQGETCILTTKEQQLLVLFIKNQSTSISFEEIMANVWEDEFDREISFNCVKNIVSSLRKKLPKNSIKSVYGKGYTFQ